VFTLVGFYDATTHASLAEVDAIPDPHVRVTGNDIYVPMWNKILAVFAGGSHMLECRLQSPSLRRMANQRIAHVYPQAMPADDWMYLPMHIYKERPRTLDIAEALNAFCICTGDEDEYVLVWLHDKLEPLPPGEIFTIEATMSFAATNYLWVNGAITFAQTLPAGRYALVGMRCMGPHAVAARCVFPDISPRPGVLGNEHYYTPSVPEFREGRLGSWGEFEHDAPPTIDVLSDSTAAITPDIQFDLIQVRAGRR